MQFVEDQTGKVLTVTIQHITDSTLQCQCSKTDKK
jgi:hypothetical protein